MHAIWMTRNSARRDTGTLAARRLLGPGGSFISEVSTLGCVCYVADKLWYATHFSAAAWTCAPLLWLAAAAGHALWTGAAGRSPGARRHDWIRQLAATSACSLAIKAFADPFSWKQAAAFALMLLAALWATRLLLALVGRVRGTDTWEGLRLGAAQAAALFGLHPYVRSAILGAGDAMSYSMMVADFRAQVRAGIFPVLIGQSAYAFNGGFQPIRNAPMFEHLAGFVDLISLGTLNVFALQNLAVLACILGAVLGCYAALRISSAKGPWLALGLSVLYGLCPGVLAPLYGGDMYITFMTLPFIPWLILGIEQSSAEPDLVWPWVVQGASLAGMWLAHPPVAAWATLIAGAADVWTAIRNPGWKVARRITVGAVVASLLGGYVFVSVSSLRLPATSRAEALASIDYKVATLHADWVNSFLPVDHNDSHLLGDVQLGYGLWACLLLSLAGAARSRSGRTLLGCFGLILLFAWPIPLLSRWAWRSLPSELLVVTNQWPMERFYVLLAALAVFIIAQAFGRNFEGVFRRKLAYALLIGGCLWSAIEARKFFRRAAEIDHTEAASEDMHLPENLMLSRTHSYEYLGVPAYYSNGHMDPRLETRLLDSATWRAFADGSSRRSGTGPKGAQMPTIDLRGRMGGRGQTLLAGPDQAFILKFDFLGQQPEGELQIKGGSLYEFYTLPLSGKSESFGSGADSSRTLIVENSTATAEKITFQFIGRMGAHPPDDIAHISIEPLAKEDRVIRLESLTPFRASVSAERGCYLETPKLFVPGYEASVDGNQMPVLKSPNGLVEVPLTKGEHEVTIEYVGSRLLHWSYATSAGAWLALLAILGAWSLRMEPAFAALVPLRARALFSSPKGRIYIRALQGAALVAVVAALCAKGGAFSKARYGNIQMLIKLPMSAIGQTEPLVTTGRAGSGDFLYVTYVDTGHVIVGHDKWNFGGSKSGPIAVDYQLPQSVEVGLSSLNPASEGPKRVFVRWNGVGVFSEDAAAYPSRPDEVTVGQNTIGGSTTLPRFSGEILDVSRLPARTAR
jgi:hypothetical protein